MPASTPMSTSQKRVKQSLESWSGTLANDQHELFRAFVETTLPLLRGQFLAHHSPRQILATLERSFLFALKRPADEQKISLVRSRQRGFTILSSMPDQPFIIDTMHLFLKNVGADYSSGYNIVFNATRAEDGTLTSVGKPQTARESLVVLECDDAGEKDNLEDWEHSLTEKLRLSQAMVRDFHAMTRTVERSVERLEVKAERRPELASAYRETADFLKWLLHENFVFMGIDGVERLGTQSIEGRHFSTSDGDWPSPHAASTVLVRKSHQESPIHRSGKIDEILVTLDDGQLFIRGLFTYRAVTQPSRNVPIIRGVLSEILKATNSQPGSYRYKGMANVFDSLPTEFLFTTSAEAIADIMDLVLDAEQQQEIVSKLTDIGSDAAFFLVAMPKAQYDDELRKVIEATIIATLQASYCDHGLFVGRYETVLLHFYLTGVQQVEDNIRRQLSERIRAMATPWSSRLWLALAEHHDESTADRLTNTYGNSFPDYWIRNNTASRAVRDIQILESLSEERTVRADVYHDSTNVPTLRIYQQEDLYLTDILPVLDNFGIVVKDSYATAIESNAGTRHMDTFRIGYPKGMNQEGFKQNSDLFVRALEAVFAKEVDDDSLNQLVLTAGLTAHEVDVVRAYSRYFRQISFKLSASRIEEILVSHPRTCASLVHLFQTKFSPTQKDRKRSTKKALKAVQDELRLLIAHDEDLIFSALLTLIKCTLRTNFYRTDRIFHYLSFKFNSSKIPTIGPNGPKFEIYVHHPDIEGVHLRFGPVARGGIRWSNRDDFRTEVLGLATTQQVKNAIIVPTGSKGGFYLKNASRNPSKLREEADFHYQTFIRGLLDLTDNSVDGKLVHPPNVVCHDGMDPYLVVAADKGTAHLSDSANSVSKAYNYWLGDAFASGGSVGFDHKEVGITARGAWVLANRHFAEMGIDPYKESFTCIGIGDMGGDVFGNGLIETPHAKLLAAFNHLHIFLDPDPDTAKSYTERQRLFAAGRAGGWGQYDESLISKGGGVFDRLAKSVSLSPEAQAMLGLPMEQAQPEVVVNAILKMEADLLWNGGIGTYVKASFQTHSDADDRSNNSVRVDATELRARIIGEGGNLGMTQQARIEADLNGVRLNTDFIDNSAGVDMSDHEVNLKILLDAVVTRGDLDRDARDALLEEITDEVADLVLANNDAHGRQLSRDQIRSQRDIFYFGRAIAFIERQFNRSPASLNLPDAAALKERAKLGKGLTRPELSVLSAWVKMFVYNEFMANEPKELSGYQDLLLSYFPKRIQKEYRDEILNHMLADEIAMTVATTRMVADAGAAFFPISMETTGATVMEIARAYVSGQSLARAQNVRSTLEQLRSEVPLPLLYQAWVDVDAGARDVVRFWLAASERIPTADELTEMAAAVNEVYALRDTHPIDVANEVSNSIANRVPDEVVTHIQKAAHLNMTLMVWAESKRLNRPVSEVIIKHIAVGRGSGLQGVLDDLTNRAASGKWEPIALRVLYNRLHRLLRDLIARIKLSKEDTTVQSALERIQHGVIGDVRLHVDELLGETESPSVATLLVLEERVSTVISRLPE
jgi:glutamate dehydrogenase